MNTPSVIQLRDVTKRYGRQLALDRVSLDVPAGVVFALLGENGAGKTTAIRLMLGLTETDNGSVSVLGLDSLRDGQKVRSRVGYVAERPTLYEWMTVKEIGWFTSAFYGSGFFDRYLLLTAEYKLPLDRKIKALSKGMRAKVSLSLALRMNPSCWCLTSRPPGSTRWCVASFSKVWSTWPPPAAPCFCPAIRLAKSSACATSWPSSALAG